MMSHRIGNAHELFDARIDIDGSSLILHSRGGPTGGRAPRNTGYEKALAAICERLTRGDLPVERILIDSAPARRLPEAGRVLLDRGEIVGTSAEDLVFEIRRRALRFGQSKGAKGGNSTKQVRFDFGAPDGTIIEVLQLQECDEEAGATASGPAGVSRLSAEQLRRVTSLDIRQAVDRLLAGEDAPNFEGSRDYDVLVGDGQRLAPKKVFGLAVESALGVEAFPGHFRAGWGQPCFKKLQEAGYQIVEKNGAPSERTPHPEDEGVDALKDAEERTWAEGDARIVGHLKSERRRDPAAAAAKRRSVRAANGGYLACENPSCSTNWYAVFPVEIAESVFEIHHTIPLAEMKEGHRTALEDLLCLCASCHRATHRRMTIES
ncbi:MAG: HNH endonuclease [Hyphomonadaceae bacterium]